MYRQRKMRDGIINHKVYQASSMVQKYLRGYKVAKQYEEFYVKLRLGNNFDYFDIMKSKIHLDAQIKIAYYWRKHKKNKKKKGNPRVKESTHKVNLSKIKPYIDGT